MTDSATLTSTISLPLEDSQVRTLQYVMPLQPELFHTHCFQQLEAYSIFQFIPPYRLFDIVPITQNFQMINYQLTGCFPIKSEDGQSRYMAYYAISQHVLPGGHIFLLVPVPLDFFMDNFENSYRSHSPSPSTQRFASLEPSTSQHSYPPTPTNPTSSSRFSIETRQTQVQSYWKRRLIISGFAFLLAMLVGLALTLFIVVNRLRKKP